MQYQLDYPFNINTDILLPSSKSISNRSLIIYALTEQGMLPHNLAQCDDTDVTLAALQSNDEVINIMAAGTAMRFLTAYFSVKEGAVKTITGTERMQNRPISTLVNALRELGADISYIDKDGFPPLRVKGKQLQGGSIELDGSISSQFISALLLIAPTFKDGLTLKLINNITSVPYINMTLALMAEAKANVKWLNENTIRVEATPYTAKQITIEPDWSAASYWFQMVALNPKASITLPQLSFKSLQGDSKGAILFKKLGVQTRENNGKILLTKNEQVVNHLNANFKEIPDLVQTFVVTAALLGVTFRFTGVETLRIKETDRINALINELYKLGYIIKAEGDSIIYWDGNTTKGEPHPVINTYEDHRMAMSFAPASIVHPELLINNPTVVSKSYPNFWEDLQKAGVKLLKK